MATGLGGEELWLCPSIDDSANDLSGNGYNGSYVGVGMGTVADTDSGGTRAYDFENSPVNLTHQVTVADQDEFDILTGADWSCSVWVKIETLVANCGYLVRWTGSKNLLLRDNGSGVPQVFTGNGGATTGVSATGTTAINDSVWHNLIVTWTGDKLRIYVDGNLEATSSTGTAGASSLALGIGGTAADSGKQFDGLMDDIRIYNRLLDSSEIALLASTRAYQPATGNAARTNYYQRMRSA